MLREWIIEYRVHLGLPELEEDLELEYDNLVKSLFLSIEEAYEKPSMQGPQARYPLSIEEIGKKVFLKNSRVIRIYAKYKSRFIVVINSFKFEE